MLLSPADAFLAVATLGTAVLIEIGVFVILGSEKERVPMGLAALTKIVLKTILSPAQSVGLSRL
jgi:hypothetical protein